MASTKAVDVKNALVQIIATDADVIAQQVQATYGMPMREPDKRWAMAGRITWDASEWVTNRSRSENFSISVVFNVQLLGGTSHDAEVLVAAIADGIESSIGANPSLGGLCTTTSFVPKSLNSWPITDGYEAQYECEVQCRARL